MNSPTITALIEKTQSEMIEAIYAEHTAMGPRTAEILDLMEAETSLESPKDSMEKAQELMGVGSTLDVLLAAMKMSQAGHRRIEAVKAYVAARRLAEDLEAEAHPAVKADLVADIEIDVPGETDTEPSFEEQVTAERQRQIELGYTVEHDDKAGLIHLYAIRNGYPDTSVKYAAMNRAINELEEHRADSEGFVDDLTEDDLLDQ